MRVAQLSSRRLRYDRPRNGPERRADLEHWRGDDGGDLIVAAVEVSWGDRIRG